MKIEEYFSKIDLNEIERFIEESQEEHITLEFKTVNHPIYTDEKLTGTCADIARLFHYFLTRTI